MYIRDHIPFRRQYELRRIYKANKCANTARAHTFTSPSVYFAEIERERDGVAARIFKRIKF